MKKPWTFLPFLGASDAAAPPQRARSATTQTGKPSNVNGNTGDPVDSELSRQATALEFSQKNEEDIVADYNAPIHMCKRRNRP